MHIYQQEESDTAIEFTKGWAMPKDDRFVHSMKGRPLCLDLMQEAALQFVGTQDFAAFAASRGNKDKEPRLKSWRMECKEVGKEIHLTTEAEGYLYKMVRSMVGAMIDVGLGRIKPNEIEEILLTKCVLPRWLVLLQKD